MKRLLRYLVPGLSFGLLVGVPLFADERPNIIIIFTDDQGYTDLGIHGIDPDVRTPNLDRLARDGVLFTSGYVTAPQCIPSRAGLIAGRHQNAFGVDDNTGGPLPHSEYTIARRLRDAGYVTGMVGKWHLNLVPSSTRNGGHEASVDYLPHTHGFEEMFSGSLQQYHVTHDRRGNPVPNPPQVISEDGFRIDIQTDAALGFLDRRKKDDRPFFLYLAYFAPHAPLQDPPHYMERMSHVEGYTRRMGLASILAMDDGVGLIREKLEEMGQTENTLIFYISDNGAPLRPGAYVGSLNNPMVGEKGMQTDGGQRVPFLLAWPGTIAGGQVFGEAVWSLDAGRTALELANAPIDDRVEGVNLMPWLLGEKSGPVHEALYWRWRSQAAVLSDGWKFIRLGGKYRYLFDMSELGAQTAEHNRIDEYPELAKRLEQMLRAKSNTWKTVGLEDSVHPADLGHYEQHVERTRPPQPLDGGRSGSYRSWQGPSNQQRAAPGARPGSTAAPARAGEQKALDPDNLQGWVLRNAAASQMPSGALGILPHQAAGQPVFLTRLGLRLVPPVEVEMELRSPEADIFIRPSWRIEGEEASFRSEPGQEMVFSAGRRIQVASTVIRADGPIVHLRFFFPPSFAEGVALRRIFLRDAEGVELETVFE